MATPIRWSTQKSPVFTALSFLNTNKYPPSLLFLYVADSASPRSLRPALIFGKVPMFYFLLHIPFIHLLAVIVCYARYGQAHWMFEAQTLQTFLHSTTRLGPPLPVVYLIWVLVAAALYPACRWFADVKRRRGDPWLSYL